MSYQTLKNMVPAPPPKISPPDHVHPCQAGKVIGSAEELSGNPCCQTEDQALIGMGCSQGLQMGTANHASG